MKVWITKYALTTGIYEIEAERCESVNHDMIENVNRKNEYYHGEGKDWHTSKESAIKRAEKLRIKKIITLQSQIDKLNKLTFS